MSGGKIFKKFVNANAIDETKVQFSNNAAFRARNAANSADLDLFKVDASDVLQLFQTPEVATVGAGPNAILNRSTIEDLIAGLRDPKDAVRVATAAALPANTPSGSGIGKTLTANTNGALTIDGVAMINGDRVLVKNQASADDGIYVVTDIGSGGSPWILTRAEDADEATEVSQGMFTWASEGTVNARTGWLMQNTDPFVVDTTVPAFVSVPIPASIFSQEREKFTLSGGDITNKYIDLSQQAIDATILAQVEGAGNIMESIDYSLSVVGGVTRITWNGLGLDGLLAASDKFHVQYTY